MEVVAETKTKALTAFALENAPALIETVFPAQKVSFEAQSERKAVAAQTLTGLGSYWKGRKPLILVRAIVLGSLLPKTGDSEKDLEIFEKLMAFDDHGLARRAFVQNDLKPKHIASRISLSNPWDYFTLTGRDELSADDRLLNLECPFDAEEEGISLRWDRDTSDEAKLQLIERALGTFSTYEEKASFCKRPEEVDQTWLYAPVWPAVNDHYAQWGIKVESLPELVEQMGMLRFGRRPRVGDTFSGGGSIPFEAARTGCDAYASDLNPIACMLTWGAFNIVGKDSKARSEIEEEYRRVARTVQSAVDELSIEKDEKGNRAKAFLYCLETRCPESGWLVPMSPSWVISKNDNVIAKLVPNHNEKRFEIRIKNGATTKEMREASLGTVRGGELQYELDGKSYRISIRTLRGEYRTPEGSTGNRLRKWGKEDFIAKPDDVYQERLYAIHWILKGTENDGRPKTYFAAPTDADLERERHVHQIVEQNLPTWQKEGLVPNMAIEPGDKTDEPIRTRGWSHWHHLFNPRQLLLYAELMKHISPTLALRLCQVINTSARLTRWTVGDGPGRSGGTKQVFDNQALNVLFNYGCRASVYLLDSLYADVRGSVLPTHASFSQECVPASQISQDCDIFITDPPYADAINYHEITEFFIAWLRMNPPKPFDDWVWDSRRTLAIKGSDDDFRRGMVDAYRAMAEHMPENGMQCVMFTHQDTGVWADMVSIFWAAGLQVVAAWYIATETTSELKKGGYVQGTVILMLRKRPEGDRAGFKQSILPAVRAEVQRQIESMMHLNEEIKDKHGEPVFNDSDLQMAGYAAALKVLTAYTTIGGEDVTSFALRPRNKGEVTVVDEIVQQAAEAANSLLVPEGLGAETWARLSGIQRFYLRMMDMETTGASKLDNYQNFAKAFRVQDYARVMGDMKANAARLKRVTEFTSRELTDGTEIGPTWLGHLIIGLQQLLAEIEPQAVIQQFQQDMPDFMEVRPLLIDMLGLMERKAPEATVREAAEVLGARLKNLRALGQ
ncbi:DNA methylase [Salinicola acroporae]|uniref:DNA methylase n=2 Tax=Salinicola acroporae TaxID=1541440 RepID=A0ABT6I204_9GAMM|nr:DNA methylase [Salinicola acroporae]